MSKCCNTILFIIVIGLLFALNMSSRGGGQDYYKILGVRRNADQRTIRQAFKKLTLQHHPDKNRDNPEKAKEMFVKIANAYEVLGDEQKRKLYDRGGEEALKYGGNSPYSEDDFSMPFNFFAEFFSKMFEGFRFT